MASLDKHVVLFFFVLVVLSSVQARESKFFSKFTHYSTTKSNGDKESIVAVPIQAPTLAPAPAPALEFVESENGYGLYGQGSGMFPPKETSTTTTKDENELLNEQLDHHGIAFDQKHENSNYNNNGFDKSNNNNNGYKLGSARYETSNYNNNGYSSNYNNNGYKLAGESYETGNQNSENGYTNNYNNNGYTGSYNNGYKLAGENYETGNQNSEIDGHTNNYNNNGYTNYDKNRYETVGQGMSDTRVLEGGKYYHEVKNKNDYPGTEYESRKNKNGYAGTEYEPGKLGAQNQGYYGNNEYPNEYNSMEEYESKEGYEESQKEFLP